MRRHSVTDGSLCKLAALRLYKTLLLVSGACLVSLANAQIPVYVTGPASADDIAKRAIWAERLRRSWVVRA